MTNAEYLADLKSSRASLEKQLGHFKAGMRIFMNNVERTDFHVEHLKKMIANYDKLIAAVDA